MRLIDADAFEVVSLEGVTEEFAEGAKYVLELLDKAPTVDAVPVVRCFECKKEGTEDCPMVHRDRLFNNLFTETKSDGFCDRGKRREQ